MRVLVLGVGMQGTAALHDLVGSREVAQVIAADKDIARLKTLVQTQGWEDRVRCGHVDMTEPGSLDRLMAVRPDVVIDLLPPCFIMDVASYCKLTNSQSIKQAAPEQTVWPA